jgi:ApbE superfamily uncharacterized protein (UPF0280 family)
MFTNTQSIDILIQTMRMEFTSDEYARICLIDKMTDLISAIKHRPRLLLSTDPVYCLSTGPVYCLSIGPVCLDHIYDSDLSYEYSTSVNFR